MIQRIQSIFLLIATLLTGSLFFSTLATLISQTETYNFLYRGFYSLSSEASNPVVPTIAIAILVTVATLLPFITIFLYKNRMLQMRLCGLSMGLQIGITAMVYFLGSEVAEELGAEISYKIPMILPVVAVILTFLAMRAIGKDMALLKSMDRIR